MDGLQQDPFVVALLCHGADLRVAQELRHGPLDTHGLGLVENLVGLVQRPFVLLKAGAPGARLVFICLYCLMNRI